MSRRINTFRAAREDLVEVFYYYASRGAVPAARRFVAATEATFRELAGMPGMGTLYAPDEPLYEEMRYFPIVGFRAYLVFYRPIAGGIEVLRVLHGARDIGGLLAEELGWGEDAGDGFGESDGFD